MFRVANQYRTNFTQYQKQAETWTESYAHDADPADKVTFFLIYLFA